MPGGESRAGHGATFRVTLPVGPRVPQACPVEDRLMRTPVEEASDEPSELAGMRVLLVEDDEDGRVSLAMLLEKCGARVTAAASAAEALAVLDREIPDVLVSDIGMAGEDGYTLIRKVRDRPATRGGQLPAVALTGYAGEQDAERARAAGYQGHLPKPIRLGELTATLIRLTSRGEAPTG
ncbi:MAG: response regulator [Candidatus Rokuibacteriota bacterium]